MSEQNVVAVYDTASHADAAIQDLKAANVPANSISRHAKNRNGTDPRQPREEPGFWASLFGGGSTVYDRSVESGSVVVTVRSPEQHMTRVSEILEAHNPVDLDERDAAYTATTTTTTAPKPAAKTTGDGTIQLAAERLTVGKRAVKGGTTRVHTYVVETPVEEQVTLHGETVHVDRHKVSDGRKVTAADFHDKTIEMQETDEVAVMGKTARVVEEISLRKEASDRVETVKDTVRHEEVKIEELGADATTVKGKIQPTAPLSPKR